MSTQPGATILPVASISSLPGPTSAPTLLISPPSIATSAVRRAVPVPSTTVPPRMTRSCIAVSLRVLFWRERIRAWRGGKGDVTKPGADGGIQTRLLRQSPHDGALAGLAVAAHDVLERG